MDASTAAEDDATIDIKHGKTLIHIEISKNSTILQLKRKIERETEIEPMNQKMPDEARETLGAGQASIESLGKLPSKVMLLGKSTKDVTELKNLEEEMLEKAPEILDDFESDILDSEPLLCYSDPVYVARLAARIEKYKGLSPLNETREGMKLLVLDIDYTLFDHRTPGKPHRSWRGRICTSFCRARIKGTTSSSGPQRACCGLKRKCKSWECYLIRIIKY